MILFKEIERMIGYCKQYPGFRGAVLLRHPAIVTELKLLLIKQLQGLHGIKYYERNNELIIEFYGGSYIILRTASDNCRGLRLNMAITDEGFDDIYLYNVIMPYLRDYNLKYGHSDHDLSRRYELVLCNFNNLHEDFNEYIKENNIMATVCTGTGYYFENGNSITQYSLPIIEFDKDNKHVLLYNAIGIDTFEYHADFVNKTKETFLVIKGECSRYDENFKNDVNIRLKIDTDVYDIYNVGWHDGILVVELFEIINNKPHFVELSSLYEDGPF